jgi:hypothetical protein
LAQQTTLLQVADQALLMKISEGAAHRGPAAIRELRHLLFGRQSVPNRQILDEMRKQEIGAALENSGRSGHEI